MKLKFGLLLLPALAAASIAPARATSLVTNGGFETTTAGAGQLGYKTNATGWSTTGYNFLFATGTADTTGANGQYGGLTLWGPNNGSANGLPASSPTGGNFIGADGAFLVAPITQLISGLTIGSHYDVGFDWAGVQQSGFNGATTERWIVGLDAESHSTAAVNDADHGFTGWVHQTLTFTATAASETLSFLAVGTPDGKPPFSLLDGVTLNATAVPEPASLAVLTVGLIGVAWRRRKAAKSVAAR